MREHRQRPSTFDRAAGVAYTFLVMNYSAVAALVAVILRKTVWR